MTLIVEASILASESDKGIVPLCVGVLVHAHLVTHGAAQWPRVKKRLKSINKISAAHVIKL